jgi:hypothetical protein
VLRDPVQRARFDAQRRAAQKPAAAPATGIAVPVRVRARRPPPERDWLIRVGPVRFEPPRTDENPQTESLRSSKPIATITATGDAGELSVLL